MGQFKYNEPETVRVPKLNDLPTTAEGDLRWLKLTGGTLTGGLTGTTATFSGAVATGALSVTGAVTGASFNSVYLRAPDSTSIGVGGSTVLSGAASGNRNTGLGSGAGASVTSGFRNTVIGYNSGDAITTGSNNVSIGDVALSACVTGTDNVAIGHDAGRVVTGSSNTLLGSDAGDGLTSGGSNTFVGKNTGIGVTTGGNNTVLGANVTGLATGLTGNIILASGDGTIRYRWDGATNTITGALTVTGDVSVPDEAYGVSWDGSLEVPTKNAIYDKIETMGVPDGDKGDVAVSGSGATWTVEGAPTATAALLTTAGGIGYRTGAGGTVTQTTSKTNGVTLNTLCGEITLAGGGLTTGSAATFTLTNSTIAAGDLLIFNHTAVGTIGGYNVEAVCSAGSAAVTIRNVSGSNLNEQPVLRFAVIKAVTS